MIDLLIVTLLLEFIVGRPCLLSHDPRVVKLLLQGSQLVRELLIFCVYFRYFRQQTQVEHVLGAKLMPLSLKFVKRLFHPKPDEKISNKLVRSLCVSILALLALGGEQTNSLTVCFIPEHLVVLNLVDCLNALLLEVLGGCRDFSHRTVAELRVAHQI